MGKDFMMKNSIFRGASNKLSLDYHSILENISEFRRSGGGTSQIKFDSPQTYYFKIFFYFDNFEEATPATSNESIMKSNFLGLTYDGDQFTGLPWEDGQTLNPVNEIREGHIPVNTALNYLLLNYEWDRARKLTEFITLLSKISYKYPWYFKTISGLDNAVTRKEVGSQEFKIEEERRSIQIKCLPDSEDNKIGRLIDLYRNIVYSEGMHKEIVPANLRKFDMGVFIFSRPIKNMHRRIGKKDFITSPKSSPWFTPQDSFGDYANFKPNFAYEDMGPQDQYKTSYKYIELHNCEFDYNSSANGYNELNNDEGFKQEYTINIFYDTAVENRYDEHTMRNIGDFSVWDLNLNDYNISDHEDAFWSVYFQNEEDFKVSQQEEYKDRKALFSNKGNTEQSVEDKNPINSAEATGEYFGVSAQDHIVKGNERSIRKMWQSKLVPENQGMLTNAVRQLGHMANTQFNKNVVKPFKKFAFGNFYAVQLKSIKKAAKQLSKGDIINGSQTIKKTIKGWKQKS